MENDWISRNSLYMWWRNCIDTLKCIQNYVKITYIWNPWQVQTINIFKYYC